jgi:hypothetical protein
MGAGKKPRNQIFNLTYGNGRSPNDGRDPQGQFPVRVQHILATP